MLILHRMKSPSSLLQANSPMDPDVCWIKDDVTDSGAIIHNVQALLRLLLKLGNHLPPKYPP
jgi:hypothetical protein